MIAMFRYSEAAKRDSGVQQGSLCTEKLIQEETDTKFEA